MSEKTSTPTPELPSPKNTHYKLEVELDYSAHLLEVSQEINYTNS